MPPRIALEGRWATRDGEPITEGSTRSRLYYLRPVLVGLDLIDASTDSWTPGPSARWLLPRATALARLWSGAGG